MEGQRRRREAGIRAERVEIERPWIEAAAGAGFLRRPPGVVDADQDLVRDRAGGDFQFGVAVRSERVLRGLAGVIRSPGRGAPAGIGRTDWSGGDQVG